MDSAIGQKLLKAASNTTKEAFLVAPFIKVDALRRILNKIPSDVPVTVVARWIPGEILAGVCDLEIYNLIDARPNALLFVHPLLHAKFYRFDDSILIGSANLTGKALGWAYPANLEILEPPAGQQSNIRDLEQHLLVTATQVNEDYRDAIAKQVALLGEQLTIHKSLFEAHVPKDLATWLPKCRDPRRLWLVYLEPAEARRRIVESAYSAAVDDLVSLGPPAGLSPIEFQEFVAEILGGLSVVSEVDHRALTGLSEEDAINLLAAYHKPASDAFHASNQWEILREWLLEFFPNKYRQQTHPSLFRIARVIK